MIHHAKLVLVMKEKKHSIKPGEYSINAIPGDKSISHRAIILGALANNESSFSNFLCSDDCLNTIAIFRQMGVEIDLNKESKTVQIKGVGLYGLTQAKETLDVGNSGTGIRLISGVLAAQAFTSTITGDTSIQTRPMKRIINPLSQMGASIEACTKQDGPDLYPPLTIKPATSLQGITYTMPVASAQVKSAILLAGLYADSPTKIIEPASSRNHTETMLKAFKVELAVHENEIQLIPPQQLNNPFEGAIPIPADISSAAFFIALGLICPGLSLTLKNIGMNPTRAAIVDIFKQMGGDIQVSAIKEGVEPYADINVRSSSLSNIDIPNDVIAYIIDEIPILSVVSMFASGKMTIRGAEELRHKESDRIEKIVHLVTQFGGDITEFSDGFEINGQLNPKTPSIQTGFDHRIAMSAIIAGAAANVPVTLDSCDCINTSFPNFFECLEGLATS